MFRCFSKIQPVLIPRWPKQTDLQESNSVFRLPSDQTSVASCSLRLGVLIVLVFIIEPERKFESLTPGVHPCLSLHLLKYECRCVWIHRHPTNNQSLPALPCSHLDLDCRTMLRCVCLYTVPHSSFGVRPCVQHTLWLDVNEFLHCSLEVCSTDIVVFHVKWQTRRHHGWDKHLACWIHRLVNKRRLCKSSVSCIGTIS